MSTVPTEAPVTVGRMNPKKNPKCLRQKNNLLYNDGKTLRLTAIRGAFADIQHLTKSQRNHLTLTPYQIYIIKRARHEHHTPKELEEMTGLSVYRVQQVVNMDMPKPAAKPEVTSVEVATMGDTLETAAVGDTQATAHEGDLEAASAEPTV